MKVGIRCVFFILAIVLFSPDQSVEAHDPIYFYIDGQEQRYQGEVVIDQEGIWVPIRPILSHLLYINEDWELDSQTINRFLRDELNEEEEENEVWGFLLGAEVKQINSRDMLHLDDVYQLGFDAFYFESERILHVNTPTFMEIAELSVGDSQEAVKRMFPDVHWNTGFGQEADLIGFIGDMHAYSYIDRYGYERKEEVPDLQVEIKNKRVTYLLVSSKRFPTSKNIKVGDRLTAVYRAYGNQYVRQAADDKQVIVYDVELGSIWFIANREQEIERIAYWDHHLRGFGENQADEWEGD